ncbi:MAG: TetR/AcrR family transcriptional regulator [Anderseniella sp.]|nr:TetR/AcrR family transcriptional regulator [Anderseniella sp.]
MTASSLVEGGNVPVCELTTAERPAALRQIKLDAGGTSNVKAIHMSWHKDRGRGYHHGNLREALIKAALDLIGSKGTGGFTFAEAARHAGVSPAAPYRHYENREALLADVATQGYAAFGEAMDKARAAPAGNEIDRLKAMGRAYLSFARDNPAYYSAMFESGLNFSDYAELRKAADATFNGLRTAVEAVTAAMPADRKPPAMMVALHIWAISHGVASLFGRGDGAAFKQPLSPEELLESHMLIYLDGLGARG